MNKGHIATTHHTAYRVGERELSPVVDVVLHLILRDLHREFVARHRHLDLLVVLLEGVDGANFNELSRNTNTGYKTSKSMM